MDSSDGTMVPGSLFRSAFVYWITVRWYNTMILWIWQAFYLIFISRFLHSKIKTIEYDHQSYMSFSGERIWYHRHRWWRKRAHCQHERADETRCQSCCYQRGRLGGNPASMSQNLKIMLSKSRKLPNSLRPWPSPGLRSQMFNLISQNFVVREASHRPFRSSMIKVAQRCWRIEGRARPLDSHTVSVNGELIRAAKSWRRPASQLSGAELGGASTMLLATWEQSSDLLRLLSWLYRFWIQQVFPPRTRSKNGARACPSHRSLRGFAKYRWGTLSMKWKNRFTFCT